MVQMMKKMKKILMKEFHKDSNLRELCRVYLRRRLEVGMKKSTLMMMPMPSSGNASTSKRLRRCYTMTMMTMARVRMNKMMKI